jgi:hypothetical protein
MKIWFRIGPDQGNERNGPQSPTRYNSAHPTVRFLDPVRFSGARLLQAQPVAPTPLLSRQHRAKSGIKLGEIGQLSDISIRHSPKYRSHRKQTIKPCLTGARIAHCDSHFSRDFASLYCACPGISARFSHAFCARRGGRDSGLRQPLGGRPPWRTCAILAGETATNGLHRTHPE